MTTLFGDLENFAASASRVFVGTPGTILKRSNASGFAFYAHQYYDALGVKRERYVAGPIGEEPAEHAVEELRSRIEELKRLLPSIRLLGREGFQLADSRAFATIAALQNSGLFGAGALLVGSHAYGVILNRLGVRAASYLTEDVDIARNRRLLVADGKMPLAEILKSSGIEFVEVPSLDRRSPSTSFKQRGRSTFQVELLAPARGDDIPSAPVPELAAHAVTLPLLGYLLAESQVTALLAREGCSAVRVPLPERFAIHKLIVSQLRRGRDAKAQKDRTQALVLCAALGDMHPGALESAVQSVPARARGHLRRAVGQVRQPLENDHPRAWDELNA
ncbi:MAG TPA: GSU2403 family nucleotidyltransferase fold protein [Thermoanaerobaculia bacterium]|nr:GSU2403 family nucleotidyltransferase fold protein [Thermoanaerobaculia bacterium]